MKNLKIIPVAILLSFIAGIFGGMLGAQFVGGAVVDGVVIEERVFVEESDSISSIEKVAPAVVSIAVFKDVRVGARTFAFEDLFVEDDGDVQSVRREVSGGSGFIVSEKGMILTNKHVVQDEDAEYSVTLDDGSEYEVKVVSRDPFEDIAILQVVEDVKLPFVKLGNSGVLKVGQKVLAIGNALAQYENTVTFGIISAKGRDIAAFNEGGFAVENLSGLLQTDAAINFGNSGGPLINLKGEVVGMNVAVAEFANAIGFAIPVDDLKPILESVEKYGEIVRPVLGVRFVMLTKAQAEEYGVEIDHGAILLGQEDGEAPAIISGGAADGAGLKAFDVILEVGGVDIDEDNPLHRVVRKYAPGDIVKMRVWREGKELNFEVELKSTKDLEL
ncbi:trypsin-like peptidase domain-containing protein [Candidatus Gracilibacteria bacterium]|nr:trypsin-like peptidase domain-containing protein [Candidatus Gracilibacteria bacterium]